MNDLKFPRTMREAYGPYEQGGFYDEPPKSAGVVVAVCLVIGICAIAVVVCLKGW